MKKHLYIHIIAIALLLCGGTVYAQDGSATVSVTASTTQGVPPKPPVRREVQGQIQEDRRMMNTQIRDDRNALNNQIKDGRKALGSSTPAEKKEFQASSSAARRELRASSTETRREFRDGSKEQREQARMETMIRIVVNRINATIVRLEKIIAKLDTRIVKFKEKGANVTIAMEASAEAKVAIANAKTQVGVILTPTSTTTASTTQQTVRSAVTAAEQALKVAHRAVGKALQSFKGQSVKADGTVQATTTTATTTTTN